MLLTYTKLIALLDGRERKRFYLLMIVMAVVTFAEILGISTLLVLLNIFAAPEKITESRYLAWLYQNLNFTQVFAFQVFLSFVVFLVVMVGLIIKAGGSYAIIRFSTMRGCSRSFGRWPSNRSGGSTM